MVWWSIIFRSITLPFRLTYCHNRQQQRQQQQPGCKQRSVWFREWILPTGFSAATRVTTSASVGCFIFCVALRALLLLQHCPTKRHNCLWSWKTSKPISCSCQTLHVCVNVSPQALSGKCRFILFLLIDCCYTRSEGVEKKDANMQLRALNASCTILEANVNPEKKSFFLHTQMSIVGGVVVDSGIFHSLARRNYSPLSTITSFVHS